MWWVFILQVINMVLCFFYLIQHILKTLFHQQGYDVFLERWGQASDGLKRLNIRFGRKFDLYIFADLYHRLLFSFLFRNRSWLLNFFDGRLYRSWCSFRSLHCWVKWLLLRNNCSSTCYFIRNRQLALYHIFATIRLEVLQRASLRAKRALGEIGEGGLFGGSCLCLHVRMQVVFAFAGGD